MKLKIAHSTFGVDSTRNKNLKLIYLVIFPTVLRCFEAFLRLECTDVFVSMPGYLINNVSHDFVEPEFP